MPSTPSRPVRVPCVRAHCTSPAVEFWILTLSKIGIAVCHKHKACDRKYRYWRQVTREEYLVNEVMESCSVHISCSGILGFY